MSLPTLADKIEKTPKYRKGLAAVCVVFGLVGFFFDVGQRRATDQTNHQLLEDVSTSLKKTDDLVSKTTVLVSNTGEMISKLGLLEPQILATNEHLAIIDRKIEAAKKQNNTELVSALQAEKGDSLSLLLSMTPGIVAALRDKWNRCDRDDIRYEALRAVAQTEEEKQAVAKQRIDMRKNCSEEARPLLISAKYVQEELLRRLNIPLTQDDKNAASIFAQAMAGDLIVPSQIAVAAAYLETLTRKFAAQPPSGLNAQTQ